MTFIMALIGVLRNFGLYKGFEIKIISTWLTMFPVAFVCGLIIIPVANRMTNKIKFSGQGDPGKPVVKLQKD